jgi:glycosyltransferase involved in cell wall biosynthesis
VEAAPAVGVRVVVDARPMQEPERSPLTASYLERLLTAFAGDPVEGESFVLITRALRDDPSAELSARGLPIALTRRIPPTTRVLRSAGMTLDSFLLRGAEVGLAADQSAVFHTAGGAVPVGSGLPIVATLLDLAPWELPGIYAASAAARFGHRLRRRVLHDATRVIVCSRAGAETARRRLHLPMERLAVVPLAVDEEFRAAGRDLGAVRETRDRLGLPSRYLCFSGRYDARKDMTTLYAALRELRERSPAADGAVANNGAGGRHGLPPSLVILVSGGADELEIVTRAVERSGVTEMIRIVTPSDAAERARIIAGADGFVYPALSEATALPVLEALSLGVPVICTRAGALPEVVASAGIVVAPRDASRLAAALEAIWNSGSLADQLRQQAKRRAAANDRTWADVARETRDVYRAAALAADLDAAQPRSSTPSP